MARNLHNPNDVSDLSLFAGLRPGVPALRQPSRNTDLETSHEAARRLQDSGQLTEQCQKTLQALVRYEYQTKTSPTSHELAGDDTDLRYLYARRLPDLEHLGMVTRLESKRPCSVTGRNAFPWSVTEKGMRAFRAIPKEARR